MSSPLLGAEEAVAGRAREAREFDYYDYGPRLHLERPTAVMSYVSDFTRSAVYRASALLGLPYRDIERLLEHKTGMDISRLLVEHGDDHLRRLESEVLERALEERPAGLIALGDSSLLSADNLALVKQKADLIVFDFGLGNLLWRIQQLAQQPTRSSWHSMLRSTPTSIADLRPFYQTRRPGFDQADIRIAADSLTGARASDLLMTSLAARSAPVE
jgi:shikimate kinase